MNPYGESKADEVKKAAGKSNEDFLFTFTPPGEQTARLFIVGDFISTSFPEVSEQATVSIKEILKRISDLPPKHLLSQLATELDKAMERASQGRHNVEFAMAAGAIHNGNVFYYLTLGDCGINIYRNGRLQLLNGSSWVTPFSTVEAHHQATKNAQPTQWPPSRAIKLGRGSTFVQPRDVEVFQLEKNDLILLFSDGVERDLSPVDRLRIIEEASPTNGIKDPESLVKLTLLEAQQRGGGDDLTLLAVPGPFESTLSEEMKEMQSQFHERLGSIDGQLSEAVSALQHMEKELEGLPKFASISGELAELRNTLTSFISNTGEDPTNKAQKNQELSNKLTQLQQTLKQFIDNAEANLATKLEPLLSHIQASQDLIIQQQGLLGGNIASNLALAHARASGGSSGEANPSRTERAQLTSSLTTNDSRQRPDLGFWHQLSKPSHKALFFGSILAALVLGILGGRFWLSSVTPTAKVDKEGNQPVISEYQILLRPDGRSLEIIRSGKLKIRPGYFLNPERITLTEGDKTLGTFSSEEEVWKLLSEWEKRALIFSSLDEWLKSKPGLTAYRVTDTDTREARSGARKRDICESVAQQLIMQLGDLKMLNPGLDCLSLEPGDVLLVRKAAGDGGDTKAPKKR